MKGAPSTSYVGGWLGPRVSVDKMALAVTQPTVIGFTHCEQSSIKLYSLWIDNKYEAYKDSEMLFWNLCFHIFVQQNEFSQSSGSKEG
jgi:hypothetical protein